MRRPLQLSVLFFCMISNCELKAQDLYTARGYWTESTREPYFSLKRKQLLGDSLTTLEAAYLSDYEEFLIRYYVRMPSEEQQRYEQLKDQWNRELITPLAPVRIEEFEWRSRDRAVTALYGIYYGASIVAMAGIENAAAAGIPLLTGGAWLLGPVINPKKYEGITQTTVRAGNTGKFLGLIYGASLGLAVAGDSENSDDFILGLSTLGSIALGEIGFQLQKKKNLTDGRIELLRHYGILLPAFGLSVVAAAESESANLYGATMLAGGIAGLAIGNRVANQYDYSQGDTDVISSLSLISAGIGFTAVAPSLETGEYSGAIFLIPAGAAVVGTLIGQKAVKGVHLTKRQGSTISLATAGSSLVGLGVVTIIETGSAAVWIGVPTAFALLANQIMFHKYKRENLTSVGFRGGHSKHPFSFSMDVQPENYFINKKIGFREYTSKTYADQVNPLVKFKLTF